MTVGPAPEAAGGSPLTTKEGWRAWTSSHAQPPAPPGDCDDDPDARARYDQARLIYLSDPVVVRTPAVQSLINNARRLLILNRRQISARRGLIITGAGGTGKTTAITQLGKAHELGVRHRDPDQSRIPVVYVTVPPAATPRMLAAEFVRFLGLPVTSRLNITDITSAVCSVLCRVGCDLVLVDEIHNLNLASRSGAEVSDQLKYFSEHIPATFVYAGVEVEQAGLFRRTARPPDSQPLRGAVHQAVRLRRQSRAGQLALPRLDLRAGPASARSPARIAGPTQRVPLPPHRRHAGQPVPPHPRRRCRRDPRRQGAGHPGPPRSHPP